MEIRWLLAALYYLAASAASVSGNNDSSNDTWNRLSQRDQEIQQRLQTQTPIGVPKMLPDEGGKFFLDYWIFENEVDLVQGSAISNETVNDSNITAHLVERGNWQPSCNQGYSSCPGGPNGGCCWPGYYCQNAQCIWYNPQVTVTECAGQCVTPGVTVTQCAGECGPTPAVTETVCAGQCGPPVGVTETVYSGQSPHTPSLVTTVYVYTTWYPIGGGTVPQSASSCITSTIVETVYGGGGGAVGGTPAPPVTSVYTSIGCPSGYYMCGANYAGGCCPSNRWCDTTTCPPAQTSTITLTIGGAASASSCPTGWFGCPAGAGGGCCPNNYICGSYCSATAPGQPNVPRQGSASSVTRRQGIVAVFGLAVAALMIRL